jgi:hypothetical protein
MAEWFKAAVLKTTGDSPLTNGKDERNRPKNTRRANRVPTLVWRSGREA